MPPLRAWRPPARVDRLGETAEVTLESLNERIRGPRIPAVKLLAAKAARHSRRPSEPGTPPPKRAANHPPKAARL